MHSSAENLHSYSANEQPSVSMPGAADAETAAMEEGLRETQEEMRDLIKTTAAFLHSLVNEQVPGYVKPRGDRVLIQPLHPDDTKLQNGIYILNQQSQVQASKGLVISVGDGIVTRLGVRVPSELEAGQIVFYSKHSGSVVEFGGHALLAVKESDILLAFE